MDDDSFVDAFESLTLPAKSFRHADHVRLAWIYLNRMPLPAAMARYAGRLQAFAEHHGATDLYHETITFAFVLIINDRLSSDPPETTWSEFQQRNPDIFQGAKHTLGRYYTEERLASSQARAHFLMPDRLAG
jgi:hypothetical protein